MFGLKFSQIFLFTYRGEIIENSQTLVECNGNLQAIDENMTSDKSISLENDSDEVASD